MSFSAVLLENLLQIGRLVSKIVFMGYAQSDSLRYHRWDIPFGESNVTGGWDLGRYRWFHSVIEPDTDAEVGVAKIDTDE